MQLSIPMCRLQRITEGTCEDYSDWICNSAFLLSVLFTFEFVCAYMQALTWMCKMLSDNWPNCAKICSMYIINFNCDFQDAFYQYFAIRHGLYGTILQLAWYHIGQIGCSQIFIKVLHTFPIKLSNLFSHLSFVSKLGCMTISYGHSCSRSLVSDVDDSLNS